jgi:hypothetical protein
MPIIPIPVKARPALKNIAREPPRIIWGKAIFNLKDTGDFLTKNLPLKFERLF